MGTAGNRETSRRDTTQWTDVIQVAAYHHTVGLRSDGTVLVAGQVPGKANIASWTGIVDIDASANNTVGLTSLGTVVCEGYNTYGHPAPELLIKVTPHK